MSLNDINNNALSHQGTNVTMLYYGLLIIVVRGYIYKKLPKRLSTRIYISTHHCSKSFIK